MIQTLFSKILILKCIRGERFLQLLEMLVPLFTVLIRPHFFLLLDKALDHFRITGNGK